MAEATDQPIIITDDETLLDLDSLNNITMDTVEAAPEFINEPPKGLYPLTVSAKIERKANKEGVMKNKIRHIYAVAGAPILDNKNELVPAKGSMISETFEWNTEGQKYWKTRATGILGDLGSATVGAVVKSLNEDAGIFWAKVGSRETKGDNGQVYHNAQINVVKKEDLKGIEGLNDVGAI